MRNTIAIFFLFVVFATIFGGSDAQAQRPPTAQQCKAAGLNAACKKLCNAAMNAHKAWANCNKNPKCKKSSRLAQLKRKRDAAIEKFGETCVDSEPPVNDICRGLAQAVNVAARALKTCKDAGEDADCAMEEAAYAAAYVACTGAECKNCGKDPNAPQVNPQCLRAVMEAIKDQVDAAMLAITTSAFEAHEATSECNAA